MAKVKQQAEGVEARHRDIGRPHAERREHAGTRQRAADAGKIGGGARDAHGGDQLVARDVVGNQRDAHAEVRWAHQAVEAGNDEHQQRRQRAGEGDSHEDGGEYRIGGAHGTEEGAVADPVARHAEHRRDQRAGELQGAEQGQEQHRAGLDQHVPAQNQRLHLEGAGGQEIGRPLQAKSAHPEGCQGRRPEQWAQAVGQWCIDLPPPPHCVSTHLAFAPVTLPTAPAP